MVLSPAEIESVSAATRRLNHRALFMAMYSGGLRVAEACHLQAGDIDSQRMVIHVRQGKGKKDRYARLTPGLLKLLREYWRTSRPEGLLFPGASKDKPYDLATPGHLLKKACRKAGIGQRIEILPGSSDTSNGPPGIFAKNTVERIPKVPGDGINGGAPGIKTEFYYFRALF